MNYGNDTISIDQMVSSVKIDLGMMDNPSYDILLEKWINEGCRHLSAVSLFVKKPLIIEVAAGEKEICLPSGFKNLLGVRWISSPTPATGSQVVVTSDVTYSPAAQAAQGSTSITMSSTTGVYADSLFLPNNPVLSTLLAVAGSSTITLQSTYGLYAGMRVSGNGIPANTSISSVLSATQIVISSNVTVPINTPLKFSYVIDDTKVVSVSGNVITISNPLLSTLPTSASIRFVFMSTDESAIVNQVACMPILIADKRFLSDCGCTDIFTVEDSVNSLTIVGNKMILGKAPELDSKIEISYIGFYKDNEDMLIILADYERALSAYARMKFLQAYPEAKGQYTSMLLNLAAREWMNQKRWVKGVAAKNSFDSNKYEISRLAKAWFSKANVI